MSRICEKCGNVIPDGMDSCPNCGREDYNEEVLRDVLNELGIPMDAEDGTEEERKTEEKTAPEDSSEDLETEKTDGSSDNDITMIFDAAKVKATAQEKRRSQAAGKRPQNQNRRPEQNRRPNSREVSSDSGKKQMKKHSAAIIGVLIGLLAALLLIAGGVGFMLYQMGFFVSMTDEELLGTTNTTTTQQVSESPTPSQEQAVVSAVEEAPVEEVQESSAVEEEPVEPSEEPVELDTFAVTGASTIYMYSRGETADVVYVISPASAESQIEWSSDDETVATVDDYGTIRARRGGICTITGSCGDTFIAVTVVCDFEVPDTVLDMNMEDITMSYEGQTVELAIDYELTQEQIDATVWESSDPSVASVNDEGEVTALSNGTAIITASIADYTASCIVRCVDVTGNRGYNSDDSEYVINYEDVTLTKKGEYFQLTITSVLGEEVPDFSWSSDDTSVAKVDSKGIVTAVSDGTAYITTQIGEDQFRCIVRVNISD